MIDNILLFLLGLACIIVPAATTLKKALAACKAGIPYTQKVIDADGNVKVYHKISQKVPIWGTGIGKWYLFIQAVGIAAAIALWSGIVKL